MNRELAVRAVITLPKLLLWKIKYGRRFSFNGLQSFDRGFKLAVNKTGRIRLGRETVARSQVCLRAEDGQLTVGDKCFFNTNVSITCIERIYIGRGCQIANNVVIVDHDHDYRNHMSGFKTAPVEIGDNVWIGANCVILKGTSIGDGAVIAAGSIVSGTVGPGTMFYQKRENRSKTI